MRCDSIVNLLIRAPCFIHPVKSKFVNYIKLIILLFWSIKVHGGTSYAEIEKKVKEAEKLARYNELINIDTILFFDEANTTDAIDLIKEIMVDRRVNGRAINPQLTRLHFIAACNPYRK